MRYDGTTLRDGEHDLIVYKVKKKKKKNPSFQKGLSRESRAATSLIAPVLQAEAKKLEDSSLYLNLPATKMEMEEKGYATTSRSMLNLSSCTISKDCFQISTLVCSTKLTQNGRGCVFESIGCS